MTAYDELSERIVDVAERIGAIVIEHRNDGYCAQLLIRSSSDSFSRKFNVGPFSTDRRARVECAMKVIEETSDRIHLLSSPAVLSPN